MPLMNMMNMMSPMRHTPTKTRTPDKEALRRYFRAALDPAELDRHWQALQRRHQQRLRVLGSDYDFRSTAFDYFLEIGLLHEPVLVEETSLRAAETLAFRDPLTGLFNYGYFEQQMRTELARAERYPTPLCLILMDLDGFKLVNDRHGHTVGNRVLKEVARLLQRGLREGDIVARLGGDEFAVLVHQSDERAGLLIAERKRLEIEERFVEDDIDPWSGVALGVTGSFGVSMLEAPINFRASLFDDADRALYQAKQSGRNRVFLSMTGWEASLSKKVVS